MVGAVLIYSGVFERGTNGCENGCGIYSGAEKSCPISVKILLDIRFGAVQVRM